MIFSCGHVDHPVLNQKWYPHECAAVFPLFANVFEFSLCSSQLNTQCCCATERKCQVNMQGCIFNCSMCMCVCVLYAFWIVTNRECVGARVNELGWAMGGRCWSSGADRAHWFFSFLTVRRKKGQSNKTQKSERESREEFDLKSVAWCTVPSASVHFYQVHTDWLRNFPKLQAATVFGKCFRCRKLWEGNCAFCWWLFSAACFSAH